MAGLEEHAQLKTARDVLGAADEQLCDIRWTDLVCRLPKQCKPAFEMLRPYRLEAHMGDHGIAFVASGHQHHRRPEIAHFGEMDIPVDPDNSVEDWSDLGVGAYVRVEAMHQLLNHLFVDGGV